MEWNLSDQRSDQWAWETEIPRSSAVSSNENREYSFSSFLDSSSKDGGGFLEMTREGSVLSGEGLIGLKLGRQVTDCREKCRTAGLTYSPVKRSRASYPSSHMQRCQVEGCNLDLVSAKDYHRRHRICVDHSKSPKVIVAGVEQRFCQQCSRLHDLSEFDDRKRSCRRRLSAHNARRRRPQTEDVRIGSTHRRPQMGFLVNRVSSHNSTPQSCNFKEMISNGGLSDISSSFHGIAPRNVNHDEANSSSINAMEVQHSFSLEPGSSWGLNGLEEPSSFDQFIHGDSGMPLEMQSTRNTQIPFDFHCLCSD